MSTAIELIAAERQRQIEKEGWTHRHDDDHDNEELADAAACYAISPVWRFKEFHVPSKWPFDSEWWKPTPDDRIRELVKAGALIVAEIERLQRKETKNG